jgi:esterase/lipase superfamily enzyme
MVQVVPVIWPCDNDAGIVKDYWDDQKAADASAFAFSRVLEKFMHWRNEDAKEETPCLKRINLLAHSMGNRVLRETLYAWAKYDRGWELPLLFRNIFMIAADVVNETLHVNNDGKMICDSARNVLVFYASDDLALRASKVSNLKNKVASRRMGHTGPENMDLVPKNVFAFDCDDINTKYDKPAGHSYFLFDGTNKKPGKVFLQIYEAVSTGRVPVTVSAKRTTVI